MPKAIDAMRKREQEIQKAILHLSEGTEDFTNPNLIMIGGYALRAFVPLSRFTRDCDFALRKKNGWNIDDLKTALLQAAKEDSPFLDAEGGGSSLTFFGIYL